MAVAVKKYNPGFLSDQEIIDSFCVRTAEFDSLVESLRESAASSSPHSLVIGPRGSGKTHLLLRVAAELRRDPALSGLFPIVFAEESYEVSTCGEFWLECLGRLAEQAPTEVRDNLRLTYDDLRTVTDDQALADRCIGSLLDFADRRQTRLVLLVENLNMLFTDIDDPDVGWRLRQTLQTESRIILFGSATSRFDEIDNPEHALYDIFRVITLRPLDTAECETLWETVAGKPSTTEAVRPLEILTGGNPRLLTIIARFGAERSFRDLMENLLDLVDEHTEYFKSHLESLPPQERRVYLALARLWKPSTTREVADLARLNTNTCSAQLKRLVARGAIAIDGGTPRRRQYYLTERLYNIYYLLRSGRTTDRLVQALIEFMISLYSSAELATLLASISRDLQASEMLTPVMADHVANALLNEAMSLSESERAGEAVDLFDEFLERLDSASTSSYIYQVAAALTNKSMFLFRTSQMRDSIAVCDDFLHRFGECKDSRISLQVGLALGTKGMALVELAEPLKALRTLDQALVHFGDVEDPKIAFITPSLLQFRGMALLQINRTEEAIATFDQVVELHSNSVGPTIDVNLPFAIIVKAIILDPMGQSISEVEFSLLLKGLEEVGSLLPGSIEAVLPYISAVEPDRALGVIQASPAAPLLLPLVTALQQELGQTPQVPKEVAEVARDVRARLAEARARQTQARAQDHAS